MRQAAFPAAARASRDPRTEGPRLARSRSLAVIFAALLAAMVGVRWWRLSHADREPWCVWATPTGRITFGPVAEFGDVRDAPGGRSREGDWATTAIPNVINGKPGPLVPALLLVEPRAFGFGSGSELWHSTGVERVGPDGVKATAFLRNRVPEGLGDPCPDASVVGTWELVDGSGKRRRFSLNANGVVGGPRDTVWGVRDGVLMIDHGSNGLLSSHFVETFVLSEDRRSIDGSVVEAVHGTKVD